MFRKLIILSFIFIVSACQTKFKESGDETKKRPDTKFNMIVDLPDGAFVQTIMADSGSCKKVIQTCSSSKDTIKKCLESNLWNEALRKFFQEQDRQVGDHPEVCVAQEQWGIAEENITKCKTFYALCKDEHILLKQITNPAIAAGATHTCILLDNNQVTCFGHGTAGQLGYRNNEDRNAPNETIALPEGRTAKMIAAGDDHTCILLDNNQVTCFGSGTSGRLGYGNTLNKNAPGETINLGNDPAERPYSVFSH